MRADGRTGNRPAVRRGIGALIQPSVSNRMAVLIGVAAMFAFYVWALSRGITDSRVWPWFVIPQAFGVIVGLAGWILLRLLDWTVSAADRNAPRAAGIGRLTLEEFTSQTLTEILRGVSSASQSLGSEGVGLINPRLGERSDEAAAGEGYLGDGTKLDVVSFDVAVTVSDRSDDEGGVRVVAGIGELGMGLKASTETSTVSRIQFRVPVRLPWGGTLR